MSTRLHPTFLKHFVIYLNGSRHAIIAFMHRYGAREQLYFYHALRNTQSPLECYYSRLRGMDSNTRISGSNITEKQAGVSLHASMKKGSSALVPTDKSNYRIENFTALEEEQFTMVTFTATSIQATTMANTSSSEKKQLTRFPWLMLLKKS